MLIMKKVLLLLAIGFEDVNTSIFTDVIDWNKLEGDKTADLITIGITVKYLVCGILQLSLK